jgi:hypothetical protein
MQPDISEVARMIKMLSKVLVATFVAGAAMVVGCGSAEEPEESAAQSEELSIVPSPVTCEGDQDKGGRICCDATHCCINIGGTINCKLPPRKITAVVGTVNQVP